jgi:hypothetical protein
MVLDLILTKSGGIRILVRGVRQAVKDAGVFPMESKPWSLSRIPAETPVWAQEQLCLSGSAKLYCRPGADVS